MTTKTAILDASDNTSKVFIGKDYRLYSDRLQWTIERLLPPRTYRGRVTKPRWELVGYYPRLGQALDALLEQKLRDSDRKDLSDLAKLLMIAKQEIQNTASTIEGE